MFQIGERIGDYEVLQILGVGGMGQVYKVRNSMTDRIEALKVLLPDLAGDPQLADRFLREIKVQASLVHRNIAQLYTARREGDQILMLMEFVDGLTLDSLLKRGPLNTNTIISMFGQVLDALSFAHANGVVHRDIKPQNIMVTADGTAKLMDFGIARMSQDQKLTQTGRTLGSLFYMSPEQIRGTEEVDGRSDLYSLGITLYEAATGARPFDGTSDYSIMAAHLQVPAVPPVDRDSRLPQILSDVIMAAIEKDRTQRFQSADAFKAALKHVSTALPSDATLIGRPPSVAAAAPAPPSPPSPLPTPPKVAVAPLPPPPQERRSNAGLMMGMGALAFAALAGLGVWQYPRMFPPATTAQKSVAASVSSTPQEQAPAQMDKPGKPDKPLEPVPTTPLASSPVAQEVAMPLKPTQPPSSSAVPAPNKEPPHSATPPPSSPAVVPSPRPLEVVAAVPHPQQQQSAPVTTANPDSQPHESPSLIRELQELRTRHTHLSVLLAGCKESMDSLEAQQRAQGLGLRGDLKDANRLAYERLREVQTALRARDAETARTNLDLAERSIDFLSKALGR